MVCIFVTKKYKKYVWLAQLVIATCIRSKTIQKSTCEITHLEWRSSKGCERLLYVWCAKVKNRAMRNTNWINARKFPQQLRSAWHSPYVLIYISLLQNYLLAPQGIFVGSHPKAHETPILSKKMEIQPKLFSSFRVAMSCLGWSIGLRYFGTSMGKNSTLL